MSSSVTEGNLEKKFKAVTNTQDCIQTLSLWILHHKAHHQKIVNSWMKVLQKAKISHRLALFYLANDVVQNGKRKNVPQFGNSFAEVLREATLLVRDEHIRPAVERVFNIWEQRGVYEADFIAELKAILANTKVPASAPSKLLSEYKHEAVIEKLRSVMKLQAEIAVKSAAINLSKLNATNAEIVQQLKDRTHGQQFSREFDDSTHALEELIKALSKEIKERTELILQLEQSEIYYDTQRGEAKIVANAYKNFGGRVKTLQKKLEELAATFPSPTPSPCPDAPSPTTSDVEMELNLPNDKIQISELENLENAPSPTGSPEGLNLSPDPKDSEPKPTTQSVGNPIPTVSNFFTQEQSGMTSWLDTFANKKKPAVKGIPVSKPKKSDPSSLDSRLSNLLQNIPNLPSGLQNTLFASASASSARSEEDIDSPVRIKKSKASDTSINTEEATPIKDECSGQNTPLQDEDTHSSNHTTFFSRLASSTKAHNPKDILKGLTNLINSAGNTPDKSDNQINEQFSYDSPEHYGLEGGKSKGMKTTVTLSQHTDSMASFFNSPQHPVASPIRTISVTGTSSVHSYQSSPFNNLSPYSTKSSSKIIDEHLSFIPSLVPSTPLDGSFDYNVDDFPLDEYNPEVENFDIDMDVESDIVHDHDVPSPDMLASDSRSPSPESSPPPRLTGRRLSTLITVITEDTPDKSELPSDEPYSSNMVYETQDAEKQTVSDWSENSDVPKDTGNMSSPTVSLEDPAPASDEFPHDRDERIQFLQSNVPPTTENHSPTNGRHPFPPPPPNNSNTSWPMSKIETVQSHRKDMKDNQRFGGGQNWTNFENDRDRRPFNNDSHRIPRRPSDPYIAENKRGFRHQNFHPRNNNWAPRERNDMNSFQHPYGPPHPKRFAFRGRGWGRRQPQY